MILAFAAAVCAVVGLAEAASAAAGRARAQSPRTDRRHPLVRGLLVLGRAVGPPAAPLKLRLTVAASGVSQQISAADVMAMRVGGSVAGALTALLLAGGSDLRTILISALVLSAVGFAAPGHWLRRRKRQRLYQASLELPAVLDLLRVAIDAGLPIRQALEKVGCRGVGVVADELRLATERIELGQRLGPALDTVADNLPTPAIRTLTRAIKRCDQHGAPLSPTLEALAIQVRSARAVALQERAATIVPRMQLVIALMLVPAVLMLISAVVVGRVL
jgi:tight adherence protein C